MSLSNMKLVRLGYFRKPITERMYMFGVSGVVQELPRVVAGLCPAKPRPQKSFNTQSTLASSLRMRHLLRLDQRIEFLTGKMLELQRGLAQARVLDVRRVRNLRRLVVSHFRSERRDQHQ